MSQGGTKYWRRIVASSAVYAAGGWAAVEALTTVTERFGLPPWLGTLVTALYVAGLPVTVFLVWRTAGEERRLDAPSFVGAVAALMLGAVAIFWFSRPPNEAAQQLVALLPCEFDGEAGQAYRAEGLAEDVHARLSRVGALKISSWNSSLFVRDKGYDTQQIARVLKADRLIQCRMTSDSDRIELHAEILDPKANRVLWDRQYDFGAADLGTIVTELAGALLEALGTPVQAAERERVNDLGTFSPEAYELLLEARAKRNLMFWSRAGGIGKLDEIEQLLDRVLEIDPNFPEALRTRAAAWVVRADSIDFEDAPEMRRSLEQARGLSRRALELDPTLPGTRSILADVCERERNYFDDDCPLEQELRLMQEECDVHGDAAAGWACRFRLMAARGEDNIVPLERWLELEPTSIDANLQYAGYLGAQEGASVEVLSVFDTMRSLAPDNRRPYGLISNLLRQTGRLDEVLAWRFGLFGDQPPIHWARRMARAATDYMNLGLYEQARPLGARAWETHRATTLHFLPQLWAALGEPDQARQVLEWEAATLGAESARPLIWAAYEYAGVLRDYARAEVLYEQALRTGDLDTLCDEKNYFVVWHAMRLVQVKRALGKEDAAKSWLTIAKEAFEREAPYTPWGYGLRTGDMEAVLQIIEGRSEEAVRTLREAIYDWEDVPHGNSIFSRHSVPIYWLETDSWFDPLRDRADFQAMLGEYHAYLEPMRQRVLEAERNGDWESLRRRTYELARTSSDGEI